MVARPVYMAVKNKPLVKCFFTITTITRKCKITNKEFCRIGQISGKYQFLHLSLLENEICCSMVNTVQRSPSAEQKKNLKLNFFPFVPPTNKRLGLFFPQWSGCIVSKTCLFLYFECRHFWMIHYLDCSIIGVQLPSIEVRRK